MSIGVDFLLKANTAAFTRGLAVAKNSIDSTKRSLASFGAGDWIKGAGLAAGVGLLVRGFASSVDHAKELSEELARQGKQIPENVAALARADTVFANLKKAAFGFAATLAGGMEKVGLFLGKLVYGADAAKEATKRLAKDTADSVAKITEDRLKKEKDAAAKKADEDKKAADEKEKAAYKLAQDDVKNAGERKEAAMELAEFERERARSKMSDEQKIVSLQKEQREVAKDIAAYEKFQKEGGELTTQGVKELTDLKKREAALSEEIAQTVTHQANTEKEVTAELKKQETILAGIAGIRGGSEFNDASEDGLQELIRRNRSSAASLRNPALGGGGIGRNMEAARLEAEAMNAEKELAFRRNLRRDFSLGGEARARRNFAGDPLQFDRVAAQLVKGQTAQEQTAQSLKDIKEILTKRGILTVPVGGG